MLDSNGGNQPFQPGVPEGLGTPAQPVWIGTSFGQFPSVHSAKLDAFSWGEWMFATSYCGLNTIRGIVQMLGEARINRLHWPEEIVWAKL